MDSWKKLEDLNLLEVQKRTQIEIACLEYIIKKDFKSLSRFNVNGFIKILQREYELDFSNFLEEYHVYLEENGIEKKNHVHISPRMNSYTKESSSVWYIVIIVVVLLIVALAWGVSRFFQSSTLDENTTNVLNQEQVVLEEKVDENETPVLNFFADDAMENNETNATILEPISENNNTEKTLEDNASSNMPEENIILLNESIIKPSAELWLGMVDLKTFRKSSLTIKNDYVLPLDKDMLITTGHAAFSLNDENNNTLEFKNGVSKFLMIKDSKIKQITKAEFIKENRGKLW
ncbi:hypothetical protein A9Y52_04500 [Campylobacter lari]|uniref:Uncharacterized protein n=1 Tax=Campylobacter lari TaxID=201 RepID=A0A5L4NNH3_CAMLA|nr:hypothetical protein [Campylobacter sp. CNRCH_2013_0898h]EAI3905497.1 hypothetical protein [Campylobacter lari]EAI3913889.1 hypothetical protein [Campylobacter lari]EAI4449718.1 hypothetical protein [Campylobacter lari]EAJ6188032.1 hypothetical protein [Campylobacter lari]EAK0828606.1 hypothetical protein [Campylobacter lari]